MHSLIFKSYQASLFQSPGNYAIKISKLNSLLVWNTNKIHLIHLGKYYQVILSENIELIIPMEFIKHTFSSKGSL